MTLIEQLADEQTWNEFFSYKQQLGHLSQQHEKELQQFIGEKAYMEVLDRVRTKGFPLPQKRLISKVNSDKKRVVYTYPTAENYLLKLLTYLLIRRYDRAFAPNLYSFRVRHGVKRAIQFLRGAEDLSAKFVYKVDIHDYFNSVDVELLLPRLQRIMTDETECFRLIADLLTNPHVALPDGQITCERKGIMAGVPLASFLANLYLNDLDWHFYRQGMLYARYSDDIILFASSAEEREMAIDYLHTNYPEMVIDGEMQVNFALDKKLRDEMYPFNKLNGKDVNTLVFPNLSSANSAYKLLLEMGVAETIGPIQMGLNKPIHFTDVESSTRDIVNLTTVAVVDAIVQEQIEKRKA